MRIGRGASFESRSGAAQAVILTVALVAGCGDARAATAPVVTIEVDAYPQFVYLDLISEHSLILSPRDRGVANTGGMSMHARYCDESSSFDCVDSLGFWFAVPKTLPTANGAIWEDNGHAYELMAMNRSIAILGNQAVVDVIESKCSGRLQRLSFKYFYSRERGLLAFWAIACDSARTAQFAVSVGRVGFAAR